ncbi:hypothetical protein DW322_08700 [Rhodococcus rhodnii]|uniref:Uncharacterized protein n=2 Tax=Rhodococcus rhodnii TaxID=38312 RepID=R7WQU9_9NOCA|nr:hypothetical protein [Rhodococcus rhodnii]EOM77665.1 hypothetical protein Rrhod_0984 [Rhodococcus rhodnii LMG 5362]TXG90287.1 hypothetical protein DW322_08700 [Rhodococcus rhodnii]
MTDHNPVEIESSIRECANRIAKGVTVCANAYTQFLAADRSYDAAFARAYLTAAGPAHEKKYAAELDTAAERETRDTADAAYQYANRQARALEAELRAWQSVGASVRSMYQVAGRGEY